MAEKFLIYLYIIEAAMFVVHEIDSAYWQEWKLFRMPGGVNLFMFIHIPLIMILFYGLLELQKLTITGIIISIMLSLSGISAFFIHQMFIKKGYTEFSTFSSQAILALNLLSSIMLLSFTIKTLI